MTAYLISGAAIGAIVAFIVLRFAFSLERRVQAEVGPRPSEADYEADHVIIVPLPKSPASHRHANPVKPIYRGQDGRFSTSDAPGATIEFMPVD